MARRQHARSTRQRKLLYIEATKKQEKQESKNEQRKQQQGTARSPLLGSSTTLIGATSPTTTTSGTGGLCRRRLPTRSLSAALPGRAWWNGHRPTTTGRTTANTTGRGHRRGTAGATTRARGTRRRRGRGTRATTRRGLCAGLASRPPTNDRRSIHLYPLAYRNISAGEPQPTQARMVLSCANCNSLL